MFDRLFLEHPRSVNETYVEHFGVASSFAGTLFVAAMAAAIHAIFPSLCETTASRAVSRLYGRMVTNRIRNEAAASVVDRVPALEQ